MKHSITLTTALLITLLGACHRFSNEPAGLKTEYLENPLGLGTAKPRFSWIVEDLTPGAKQTAYQVQAASSAEKLAAGEADLWDSGKVGSNQSHLVVYEGKPLSSRQQVWWRVKNWDQNGKESAWSEPAWFEMGLTEEADWTAHWICTSIQPVNNDASDFWVHMTTVPVTESNFKTASHGITDGIHPQNTLEALSQMPTAAEMSVAEAGNLEILEHLTPCPLVRREVELNGKIKRARAYVSAPGFFELRINGKKVGDRELEPGVSPYHETSLYAVHDITPYVQKGMNAVGLILGHGIFNNSGIGHFRQIGKEPVLLAQFEFEFNDGSRLTLGTDESWKTAPGPILKDSHFLGECYDARLEVPGWDQPGFDDREWKEVITTDSPARRLDPDLVPPERVVRRVTAKRLYSPAEGVWVYDMGEAFSGAAELKVTVPAGTMLTLRYAQRVFLPDQPYGSVLRYENITSGEPLHGMIAPTYSSTGHHPKRVGELRYHPFTPADVYVARGVGEERWRRRFSYSGFRYVELTGYPGEPPLDAVTGVVVHTALPREGKFECSNDLLNRIHEACANSYLYCTHGFTQDNPTREKQYCPEMTSGSARLAATLFPQEHLWIKMIESSLMTQDVTGHYQQFCGLRGFPEQPLHEDGPIRLTYLLWQYYGDERMLHSALDAHAAYFDYYWDNPMNQRPESISRRFMSAEDLSKGYLRGGYFCFDWYADDGTTIDLPYRYHPTRDQERPFWGTGFLLENLDMFLSMARHAGRADLVEKYDAIFNRVRDELNGRFYNAATGSYGSMGNNALALSAGLVPDEERSRVVGSTVDDIMKLGIRMATGTHGSPRLLDALSTNGHEDLAYELLTRDIYPSLGHMLKTGCGTLFEQWDTFTTPYGRASSTIQSERGRIGFWFAEWLGGIQVDPLNAGFRQFLLRPVFPEKLGFVRAEVPTPYGNIKSSWSRDKEKILWQVSIPWNSSATVKLNSFDKSNISVNDQPADNNEFMLDAGLWSITLSK